MADYNLENLDALSKKLAEVVGKEIENYKKTIMNGIAEEGQKYAQNLAGDRFKVKVNIDDQKSKIWADGSKAMEIEEKEKIFSKTAEYMTSAATIHKITRKFKRCTDDFKSKGGS